MEIRKSQALEFNPSTTMNVAAEEYHGVNGQQERDAIETINEILKDSQEIFDIILDVGCGTGNVTRLLSTKVPHRQIVAIDIDGKMIEFSQKVLPTSANAGKVTYLQQDISLPWNQLHPQLQDLEGKISLVWSNRVLHWIRTEMDRRQAARNIVRLLQPGGRLYINTTLVSDLSQHLPDPESRAEMKKIMIIPSRKEQHDLWKGYFLNLGLKDDLLRAEFLEKVWIFSTSEEFWKLAKVVTIYKRFLPGDMPEVQKDEIIQGLYPIFARFVATPFGQPLVEPTEDFRNWHYGQFRIRGQKAF